MHSLTLPSRDLVLVGAGHTNLHVVRQWRMRPIPDVQLTLVTPFSRATYSGMLPGTLAGLYTSDDMQIDLCRFTAGTGIRLIIAEATGLNPHERLITFADRPPLRFEVASVGIGSVPNRAELWRNSPRVLSIKPMTTFLDRLLEAWARSVKSRPSDDPIRCIVVGSGAAGTEVAFCLDAMLRQTAIPYHLTLLDHHTEILPGYVPAIAKRARQLLASRGINIRLGRRATELEESGDRTAQLILDDATTLPVDFVIWATSASPPDVLHGYDLPKTADGFLAVRSTLQTTGEFPVFAVGDTASFIDLPPVPKAGVYAVREGPILWENLQRQFANRPLIPYRPQRGFLSLLSSGDGQALLQYHGWTARGKWVWRLKDHIDRKFMQMYQDYRLPMPQDSFFTGFNPKTREPTEQGAFAQMHCGGCGCKVGANVLASALGRIREMAPDITAALKQPEDAHVLPADALPLEVLSVDFFRSFLSDPHQFGRVSVLHALSDIWAMGAKPTGVQAIVTLPYGPSDRQAELLFQILAGAVRELSTHRVALWGGHTIAGPELQLGFSVAGSLQGKAPWLKSGLTVGDSLVLTKRLGSGVLLAGHQQALSRGQWMDELLHGMLISNACAADIARQFPISAATDITGFGFAGHLLEMLEASHCSCTLDLHTLQGMMYPGFAELVEQGVQSTLAPSNRQFESQIRFHLNSEQQATRAVLFDPQTSGGLLLGVPALHAADLVESLTNSGHTAAIVGQVIERSKSRSTIDCFG